MTAYLYYTSDRSLMEYMPVVTGILKLVHASFSFLYIQKDKFVDKMTEMSSLRWLRLNRSQLGSLPDEIDQFQKLVCRRFT